VGLVLLALLSSLSLAWNAAHMPWQFLLLWGPAPLALLGLWHLPGYLRRRRARREGGQREERRA
jgi:hypothetical protein